MKYSYMDCLAELGVGGAHPGGLSLTKKILSKEEIQNSTKVLDAGCGTGRTSLYISEKYGCCVTGVDNHQTMIKKTRQRCLTHNITIDFVHGSTEKLPFDDNVFDIVLSESVIAFTDASLTIPEMKRVLTSNGIVLAIEMVLENEVSNDEKQEIQDFYRVSQLLTVEDWDSLFQRAGFQNRSILSYPLEFDQNDPDLAPDFLLSDNMDPMYFDILKQHEYLTQKYKEVLGYRIFRCAI
ncbi:class I SAM-dependent methyltransferase [Ornithinibacillus salinisoli]|uniref:Class I SAM-dependent methyltransferase n=1 Tax=Ornithinibacillus salinisoli TaxID=1848459 RepID=A0ABW4W425_9BACI